MNVRFYSGFSKRKNSTKIPTGTYASKTVRWKENTSIHNPVIELAGAPTPSYTYCYIQTWGKYYYVEDVVTVANGVTEYHLKEDVMASEKTAIGNTSARVAFCSSVFHADRVDNRCAVSTNKKLNASITTNPVFNTTGFYVLTVFNDDQYGVGCSTSYAMLQSSMDEFRKFLADDSVFGSLVNFFNGSPLQTVMGCVWVPFDFSDCPGDDVTNITCGDTDMNTKGYYITTGSCKRLKGYPYISDTYNIACNLRYTDFRAVEPYTSGTVYLPGVGNIDVNMSDWKGSTKINVSMTREVITGNVTYLLFRDDGALVQSATCCVASQCPLGQTTVNTSGAIGSIKTMAAGAVAVAAAPAALTAAAAGAMISGAANMVLSFNQRAASVSGAVGGRSATIWPYIHHIEYSVDTEDVDDSTGYIQTIGRPLGEVALISQLSGYIQCDNAQVSISGSEEERDEINAMMNAGFYYE